jgi:hypothetical protein
LRFEIKPLEGEGVRACVALASKSLPESRATLIILGLYAAVAAAAYFLTPTTRPLTFLIGLGAVLGTNVALAADARRRLRAVRRDDPHALETHYVELSAEGVRSWCAHVDARYPWNDFSLVTENNEFYLLARPNGSGTAVPKRLLSDEDDEELRRRLAEWSSDRGARLARRVR